MARVERERLVEVRDRAVELARVLLQVASREVGPEAARIERDRRVDVGARAGLEVASAPLGVEPSPDASADLLVRVAEGAPALTAGERRLEARVPPGALELLPLEKGASAPPPIRAALLGRAGR